MNMINTILMVGRLILPLLMLTGHFSFAQQTQSEMDFDRDTVLRINTYDTIQVEGSLRYAGDTYLVIMIAGSGPTDRNCNNHAGLQTNAFKHLADSLHHAGFSSFRYDKRGIGASTKVPESTMTMEEFIEDASVIVNYFTDSFDKIFLLGHSEGALIANMVGNTNAYVKGCILVSGTAVSLDSIFLEQLAKFPKLYDLAKMHIEEIKTGKQLSEVNPMLASLFRPSVVPFLTSAFSLDPLFEIQQLNVPAILIGGTCDRQVSEKHTKALANHCEHCRSVIIEGMGHTLKDVALDCKKDNESYTNPEMPIHPQLIEVILSFLHQH